VVTSEHRTLTTSEKMQPADGRAAVSDLLEVVQRFSRTARIFDMAAVAQQTGTVLSAVLFGAIAGSAILPFTREACEQTIRRSGKGVEASLRGFAAACEAVSHAARPSAATGAAARAADSGVLPTQIAKSFPAATHDLLGAGYARMLEYQDAAYAQLYIGRLARVLAAERAADPQAEHGWTTTRETARYLALWMAFDDIVRVADLKCRATRFARVRHEVKAAPEELVRVFDHFKPGIPELAALLPQGMARALAGWDKRRQKAGKVALALPLKLGAHTVSGLLALRLLAGLKGLRRRGSRFAAEQALIERWLAGVEEGTREHWALGHEIALCGRLIKGYGSTNERGKDNLLHVLEHLALRRDGADAASRARAVRAARLGALADDAGKALDQALVEHGAPARPIKAQPVRWVKKRPQPAA
jgi:indolepyruvate ferredoxin oxidoreductase beta subunit